MAQVHSLITVAGRNKLAAKVAAGQSLVLTEIALGSGDRFPGGGETALQTESYRGAITASGTEPLEPNAMWFNLYVQASVPTMFIQEIGLFDEDGVLFAISRYSHPVPKFGPDSSNLSDNTFRIVVVFSDVENIVIQTSPVAGLTAETLPEHLPWATPAEAGDIATSEKLVDPANLWLQLTAFARAIIMINTREIGCWARQAEFDRRLQKLEGRRERVGQELANLHEKLDN
jgi:hypothetical protein